MPKAQLSRRIAVVFFVLSGAFFVATAVFYFLQIISVSNTAGSGLSAGGAEVIKRYCQENRDVIEEMPRHPRTQEVLDGVVSIWCKNSGAAEVVALEELAKAFKDSPLGLAALEARLRGGEASSAQMLCRELVAREPDSRVACMALEWQVEAAPEAVEALLKDVVARYPGTRVCVFAMTVKGDRARDRGEMAVAAKCWLEAWITDPKRATPLYGNLCMYWMQNVDWYYPLLMPVEFREDPVLTPVKQHALAAVLDGNAGGASLRAQFRQAGKALQSGDIEGAVAVIDQAMADGATAGAKDKAFFGTAAFLLGAEKDYTITLDLASSLKARRVLTQCRERCLQWAREGLESLPRELQACYALQIANRRLQDGQVQPAIDLLQAEWKDKALPARWRLRNLEELSKILVEENSDFDEAARAYAAYCDESPQDEARLRLVAANLFCRGRKNAASLEQVDKLMALATAEDELPAALLLRGLNYLDQGNSEEATVALEQLALNHPQNELAAQALFLLAKMALAAGNSETAEAYYQDLIDRYPESQPASEAQIMLAQIREDSKP